MWKKITLILVIASYVTSAVNESTTTISGIFTSTSVPNVTRLNVQKISIQHLCSVAPSPINLATFICIIIFIPITVFGNILVCMVVLASASLRKQTTFMFLVSLAVADTLIGAVSMPLKAKQTWNNGYFCMSTPICWMYVLEENTLSLTSVVHLFFIAIDRFLSLKYVYEYNSKMTQTKAFIVIFIIWFVSITWSLIALFQWQNPDQLSLTHKFDILCGIENREYYVTTYVAWFIIPTGIMIFTYSYVYRTAMRHINDIAKNDIQGSKSSKENRRRKRQFKIIRSIVIVFAVYTICWIPTVIFILCTYYTSTEFWRKNKDEDWFIATSFLLLNFLPPLNSTTNPFIYVMSNRQFRLALNKLTKEGVKRSNTLTPEQSSRRRTTNKGKINVPQVHDNISSLDRLDVPTSKGMLADSNGNITYTGTSL